MLELTRDREARGATAACLNGLHKEYHMHNHHETPERGLAALLRTPQGAALAAVLTAALIYVLVDHTAHVLGALPYLLVLLCPLMHLLMMRGMHGGNDHHGDHTAGDSDDRSDRRPED